MPRRAVKKALPAPKPAGWIGVDLDGTLARNDQPFPEIGEPVPAMVARVRAWVDAGIEVRIVTARASGGEFAAAHVRRWLAAHGLPILPITAWKDDFMFQLWDDRAVRVERDTGRILGPDPEPHNLIGRVP